MSIDQLIERIQHLHNESGVLEPREEIRHELLQKVNGSADRFLNAISDARGFTEGDVSQSLAINNAPHSLEKILKLYEEEVMEKGIRAASGGHVGYIPGGGIYAAALGDYLADVTNEYAGVYYASPGAVTIENEVINWLKKVFHFPETAVGNLASGGSIANLIALTAARDKHKIKGATIEKSVIYLSPQVHHCLHKAIRIIGLEDVIVREVELDELHRINAEKLKASIAHDKAEGLNPFLVIASAGTTDTGAVDPLKAIGEICQQEKLWYHIDGAYGGFFILLDEKKHFFEGIELADSLVMDPHKGMFLPYGLGAVLVKDKEAVTHSHQYTANYMQDAMDDSLPVNPADVSPELTKHFRGLRMWLPLQLYGLEPFKACLKEKLLLTQYFRLRLTDLGFEVGPEPDLSVSYFRYVPEEGDANAFNRTLMEHIHKDGDVFLSSTMLNGSFVIRMAILSFRTKMHTIDRAVKMVERALERVKGL